MAVSIGALTDCPTLNPNFLVGAPSSYREVKNSSIGDVLTVSCCLKKISSDSETFLISQRECLFHSIAILTPSAQSCQLPMNMLISLIPTPLSNSTNCPISFSIWENLHVDYIKRPVSEKICVVFNILCSPRCLKTGVSALRGANSCPIPFTLPIVDVNPHPVRI